MDRKPSGQKRLRQSIRRRERNRVIKGYMRQQLRAFRAEKDADKKKEMLPILFSVLDKAAKKGVIHKRTAARYKSRISK